KTIVINETNEVSKELVAHLDKEQATVKIKEEALKIFNPIFAQLKDWRAKIETIDVKEGTDIEAIELAGRVRKDLKNIRLTMKKSAVEKIDKVKEDMKPYLEKIEAWKTVTDFCSSAISSLEKLAEDKEKVVQNFMIEQRTKKISERTSIINEKKLNAFFPPMIDLGTLPQEEFDNFLAQAIKLKDLDDKEKEAEKREAEKEAKAKELALRTATREKELLSEGFKETEETFVYEEKVIITKKDIENLDDEKYLELNQNTFKDVFEIRKKKAKEKAEADAISEAKKEREALVLKTKEYFINKGFVYDEGFNEYVYTDPSEQDKYESVIVSSAEIEDEKLTKDDLRNLMVSATKRVQDIIEKNEKIRIKAENAKKVNAEQDRQ